MKRSRFGEEPIVAILKEQEAGMATEEVRRRRGTGAVAFYKRKAKYGVSVDLLSSASLRLPLDGNPRI